MRSESFRLEVSGFRFQVSGWRFQVGGFSFEGFSWGQKVSGLKASKFGLPSYHPGRLSLKLEIRSSRLLVSSKIISDLKSEI